MKPYEIRTGKHSNRAAPKGYKNRQSRIQARAQSQTIPPPKKNKIRKANDTCTKIQTCHKTWNLYNSLIRERAQWMEIKKLQMTNYQSSVISLFDTLRISWFILCKSAGGNKLSLFTAMHATTQNCTAIRRQPAEWIKLPMCTSLFDYLIFIGCRLILLG